LRGRCRWRCFAPWSRVLLHSLPLRDEAERRWVLYYCGDGLRGVPLKGIHSPPTAGWLRWVGTSRRPVVSSGLASSVLTVLPRRAVEAALILAAPLVLAGCSTNRTGATAGTSGGSSGDSGGSSGGCPSAPGGYCGTCFPYHTGPGLCAVYPTPIYGECGCPFLSPCPGWCLPDGGIPDPLEYALTDPPFALCPGFCLGIGGSEAPAAPCDGGCGWFSAACTPEATNTCCPGLDCEASVGDAGQSGVCCGPENFSCAGVGGSACCSGLCGKGAICVSCVPLFAGTCTATADCCNGVCEDGGCQCVCPDDPCAVGLDCCSGKCGSNGRCE
jgi:hypothetical protein